MDPLSLPWFHQTNCVASKCKLIWSRIRHVYISWDGCSCHSWGACSALPRCPHAWSTACHCLVFVSKWIGRDKAKSRRWWATSWNSDPRKPSRVWEDLTTRARRGGRWQEGVVIAPRGGSCRRVIPISFDTRGSRRRGAQWRCNRGTNRACVNIEVVGELRGGCWWRWWGEVLEPWDKGIGVGICVAIGSIGWRGWAWERGWSWAWVIGSTRAWVIGSTRAWVKWWARAWRCWATHNIHALQRFASLKDTKRNQWTSSFSNLLGKWNLSYPNCHAQVLSQMTTVHVERCVRSYGVCLDEMSQWIPKTQDSPNEIGQGSRVGLILFKIRSRSIGQHIAWDPHIHMKDMFWVY